MIASPFTTVGGGDFKIQDLFVDNSKFTAGYNEEDSDVIKVWDGTTYVTYMFSAFVNAWTTVFDSFTETDEPLPSGVGAWYVNSGNTIADAIIAGEVITTNYTVSVGGGFEALTLLGNPFSEALPLSSIISSGLNAGYNEEDSDVIKVWDGTTYVTYMFSAFVDAWTTVFDSFTETDATIPANDGFWFVRLEGGATTLTLKVPYDVD